ncbi:hypothetical protein M422DRAFT_252700 [Sphaerobolus stellatus SS14]|uniref:Uncharacterized protein n=1 Tax=Sphaerobolus stellatus (strain SS14) TaxID=990650 RepID=A0A0C9UL70_SPHS4|nr:hypothetical protein M422DRAFT_252700 [Sphaerobolus stellatus SS14]
MMHRRATRIRKTAVLDLLASFNVRQEHPIASSCGALLEMDTSATSAQHLHPYFVTLIVLKTLPPAPNPFDTTLPTIHHSNVGLQARRRIPYEDQTLLQRLNKSSHETIPFFLQNPTASIPPTRLFFSTLFTPQFATTTTPGAHPYYHMRPIATSLLRVDDPSSTSLITIPESTVITVCHLGGVCKTHEERAKRGLIRWMLLVSVKCDGVMGSQYGHYRSMEARMPSSLPVPSHP